ncbi:hypothetical protein L596_029904 [Steinernema carpocapsae]|uniref:Uncharacterized protein n=1 Tax=Steinernema carpocapsae TaxID=34508 RepID=A0A4U5LR58_STECR|nr:hypothetical protein L596_029904 [Steinernema carpocapsae]
MAKQTLWTCVVHAITAIVHVNIHGHFSPGVSVWTEISVKVHQPHNDNSFRILIRSLAALAFLSEPQVQECFFPLSEEVEKLPEKFVAAAGEMVRYFGANYESYENCECFVSTFNLKLPQNCSREPTPDEQQFGRAALKISQPFQWMITPTVLFRAIPKAIDDLPCI